MNLISLPNQRSLTSWPWSKQWMLKTGWILIPSSNSNTEEIEELLRVEEEILNSPPKAETAPKADIGDRVCLSGAARKRLSYFRTKGVPLEQALVMARQPMPKSEKSRKAESSRKLEISANTTPETNLPKRGSAKPEAGTTPARVPEIKAVSTDQKAAQPLTPRPTETTGTRENFAMIPKGYPKAIFSTKEASTGCSFRPGWLLISCAHCETADRLKVTVPKLNLWNGAQVDLVQRQTCLDHKYTVVTSPKRKNTQMSISSNSLKGRIVPYESEIGRLKTVALVQSINAPFYINEQLTKCNYNIFKEAMKMKKRKVLSAVFTRRALVYVRQKVNDDFVCLKSMDDLLALDLDSAAATETAALSAGVSQAGHSNFR
ncbi:hypothetical protein ACLKA7_001471 [Drosophila subpalustris]